MNPTFSIIAVFTDTNLDVKGNTACVVHLENELPRDQMQSLASDFNQPATTFLWTKENKIYVRWFAPDAEIGLCGHGALAAFAFLDSEKKKELHFHSGIITGWKNHDSTYSIKLKPIDSEDAGNPDDAIVQGLSSDIKGYFSNDNKNIVLLQDESAVRNANPDFHILRDMDPFGIILTAPGDGADFVSRTLVPKVQQKEDHATGSSHAALTPFWSKKLNKKTMTARQLSPRGGAFKCEMQNGYVILTGETQRIASGNLR